MRRAALAYIAWFVAIGVFFPYLPLFYQALGFSFSTIGFLAAIAAATGLVAGPAWGIVTDRFDRRGRALPVAALLSAVAAAGLWLVGHEAGNPPGGPGGVGLALVVVAAVALSAASSGIGPQLDARAVGLVAGDRARYGRLRGWGSLSFIVTAALVGQVLDRTGPSGLFAVYLPAVVITAVITFGIPQAATDEHAPPPVRASPLGPGLGDLLRIPELRAYLLAAFAGWAALNATNAFLSVDLVALGASPNVVGIAWAVGAGLEVPVMWAFPRLARRFGMERLLVVGPLVLAVRALGCALAPSPEVLVAVTALQGIGFALSFVGGVAHVARLSPRRLGATAQGVFAGATVGLGAIVGSGMGGLIVGFVTLPGVFALSAAGSVVSAALVARSLAIGRRHADSHDGSAARMTA
ncbi:MAG TPA: MFS transporter [Candidatus Limnocylindrales bacterium]|nr:MFS transporter [Candidatus Limnocylindrales bacterium]